MSILQEIHNWSQGQPAWQQDAIRRLYVDRNLSATDLDDLYALAKTAQGIEDPEKRKPSKLADTDLAASPVPNRLVQITAIKDLVNVNALAEGQSLPISPTGLTVIYGENGSGKSGYSRVLKKACRARDQAEPILPDARKPRGTVAAPKAGFDVVVNGAVVTMTWQDGHAAPEELSEIAIFDAHCARAYVDNQGDFAYAPYGLDILEGLVKVCNSVRNMASKEMAANKPNIEPFAVLAKTPTKVGAVLNGLSGTTKVADVEALATLTDVELKRLAMLNKTLAEADPKQKAQVLRLRSTRFTGLANRIDIAVAQISEEKIKGLQELVQKSNAAKQAAKLASKGFKEKPGQLPGTGGDPWKELFEAARVFAAESHAGHDFPNLPPGSQCPLCQNTLGDDGATRLVAFDAFIEQTAEKTAKTAKATAVAAYRAIENAMLDLAIDDALGKEIKDAFAESSDAFADFQKAILNRRADALNATGGTVAWESIGTLPANPSADLNGKAAQLLIEAKALEESMDVKAKAAMVTEQVELDSRSKLFALKSTVLDVAARRKLTSRGCGRFLGLSEEIVHVFVRGSASCRSAVHQAW